MRLAISLVAALCTASVLAQTSAPAFTPPKRIPAQGVSLTDGERAALVTGLATLERELAEAAVELAREPRQLALLPDAEVFHKAVAWSLADDTFYSPKEITLARRLIETGRERVAQLRAGRAPWLQAKGLVVRGYRSKLDGSVQPYGLVVPETGPAVGAVQPMMVWLLGRGEKRTELAFIAERESGPPQLTPAGVLTLIPYGRFCNATKFAGEVDVMEALAAVRAHYPIDPQRIAVAGFSMGGGSTWHLATHFPGLWCVASPGAGFAETPIFTKALAPGKEARASWEQLLWRQYEGTGLAGNLAGLPTLAYAGEIDGQKEASDLMEAAATREGVKLERFIGPQTAHKYHPETKETLTRRLEELIARGRAAVPNEVRFATYTLRYAESAWVRIEGMGQHWERAEVRARLTGDGVVEVTTANVTHLLLSPPSLTRVVIDGKTVVPTRPGSSVRLQRTDAGWREFTSDDGLRKRPGLTGPVDDAFVEPFLFVRPTGKPLDADVGAWVESELTAARHLWRDVFRGEVPTKSDREVTDADIADRNLILWGDPSSNAVLARILAKLPLQWDAKRLVLAGKTHVAGKFAPILVFPNPLNPRRYVVLNSGLDFRSEGYGNNALQTAKLPDWAVIDVRTPAGPRWPGKVVEAGFFNEQWR
jgi:dienelactone hydrolase